MCGLASWNVPQDAAAKFLLTRSADDGLGCLSRLLISIALLLAGAIGLFAWRRRRCSVAAIAKSQPFCRTCRIRPFDEVLTSLPSTHSFSRNRAEPDEPGSDALPGAQSNQSILTL